MKDTTKLFQHGTLGLLVPGLFDGTLSLKDLLTHGNMGIGTAEGLDGEMIILNGTPYLVRSDGSVADLSNDDNIKVPFANVHFSQSIEDFELKELNFNQLGKLIFDKYNYRNIFFAIIIKGDFDYIKTRAVEKQTKPYPTLREVADKQAVFEEKNSKGTIMGYYSPELFHGMAAAGFHVHYLNDNHTMGGHLLDFKAKKIRIYLQPFESVETHFPINNQEFMQEKFDIEDLKKSISDAES